MKMTKIPNEIKILCIGNSFSDDTIEHVANIALSLGVKKIILGNLMIGGCSIDRHYSNIVNDSAEYEYRTNKGAGWENTLNYKMTTAIKSADWDFISIQHGSADGSRYTSEEAYKNLPLLIKEIKKNILGKTKIVFNMAWVGEEYFNHPELISYNRNQLLMYTKVAEITKKLIVPMEGIDIVSPTGTAVQNARTSSIDTISRDGYHLSWTVGRYLAGLTFFKALTGISIDDTSWTPKDVSEYDKQIVIESANNAIKEPFKVTKSKY